MSNVVSIEKPQLEPKPAKFRITCELEGFTIEVEAEGKADNLKALIGRLKAIGAQPLTGKSGPPKGAESAPRCPIHNKQMKPSRKPGSFFCPARTSDGDYCTEKA
jgi:hypothetical protein